jgi:hypothetical protein
MGTGATASSGLVDTAGGGSGVALFDPETGASSAAGGSFVSTGAVTSAGGLAELIAADSAGVLLASGLWLDMGAGPPSGASLASTGMGASDAGATSGAALFNSTDSRGSSGGRGRGNGGDDTVRWL